MSQALWPERGSPRLLGRRVLASGRYEADAVALVLEDAVALPAAVLALGLRSGEGLGVVDDDLSGDKSGRLPAVSFEARDGRARVSLLALGPERETPP